MMAVTYSFLALLLSLIAGGGNDLLDYLPSDTYWSAKGVTVSVDAMVAELADKPAGDVAGLIDDLGSPDAATRDLAAMKIREAGRRAAFAPLEKASDSPDAEVRRRARALLREIGEDEVRRSVRRLVAIRTLGELGKAEAIPALKPLLASKDLFVADYAQAAIDMIEGRDGAAWRAVPTASKDDVWLLPKECRAVAQIVPRRGTAPTPREFFNAVKGDEKQRDTDDAATTGEMVLAFAEQYGNIRLDAVTIGLAGNPASPDGGAFIAVIVRGRYDAEWVRTYAQSKRVPSRQVAGVEVFEPDAERLWFMPSNEVLVFVAATEPQRVPVEQLIAGVKGKRGTLAGDAAMRKLVASVDSTKQVVWAVAIPDEAQRRLPVASAFDTITALGARNEKTMTMTLSLNARGRDANAVKSAVDQVNKHLKDSAEFLSGIKGLPLIDMAVELLRSARAEAAADTSMTLTAKIATTPAAILGLPALYDEEPEPAQTPRTNPRLRSSDADE